MASRIKIYKKLKKIKLTQQLERDWIPALLTA